MDQKISAKTSYFQSNSVDFWVTPPVNGLSDVIPLRYREETL